MRVKFYISLILISTLILSSFSLYAETPTIKSTLENRVESLKEIIENFNQLCVNEKGEIDETLVVADADAVVNNTAVINCKDEAIRLAGMIKDLKELKDDSKALTSPSLQNSANIKCLEENLNTGPIKPDHDLAQSTDKILGIIKNQECEKESNQECFKDLTCNILSSTVLLPIHVALMALPAAKVKAGDCFGEKKSNCASELLAGFIKDIWSNITGICDMAKMAAKGAVKVAKKMWVKAWNFFEGIEDKTSEAALIASAQTDSKFEQFKKDPIGYLKDMGLSLINLINDSLKDNFGCELWSGAPHFSTCLRAMSTWSCSSCDKKLNAFCGTGGLILGEIGVAYLTGGLANIAAKSLGKGAVYIAKVNQALIKAIPKIEKIEIVVATAAKIVATPLLKSIELVEKLIASKASQRILEFAKNKYFSVAASGAKLAAIKPVAFTLKIVKGVTSPVKAYLNFLDKSAELGVMHSDILLKKASNGLAKFSEMLSRGEKMKDIESVVINLKDTQAISPEILKSKLEKEGANFSEVTLENGEKGFKVKVPASCELNGKNGSFVIK